MSSFYDKGFLYVVVGPSGAGKSFIVDEVLKTIWDIGKKPFASRVVTCTTRDPRPGEKPGKHYHFFTKEMFKTKIENNEFLEWAEVYGNYYGTLKSTVDHYLDIDIDAILIVDNEGAKNVKANYPDAKLIYMMPPSLETLRNRLVGRGTDSEEVIERRFGRATAEMAEYKLFDYVVVNEEDRINDLQPASEKILSIMKSNRCTRLSRVEKINLGMEDV